ncbi:MAG: phosphate acyltransferase PlsX [Candidatus Latescibacterota bacterium]|nr:MAG: phosphate acyltransferase PlsX [Candidatus Latescibacterota bacterium]
MRLAVDAMGGDRGPRVVVPGTLRALAKLPADTQIAFFGQEERILAACRGDLPARVTIEHAPDEVSMHESPATAVRRKPDSSLARALRQVKEGQADAILSAGSTGAVVAGGLLALGRIGRVQRPAIATLFPTDRSRCVVVDVGANSDCKPSHLLQFAAMGAVYAHIHLGLPRPRIGLLNIGEEESKGNELAVSTHALLRDSGLNFVGNVEGRDVLAGRTDVVVCDGFVGNIVLKFGESMLRFLTRQVRSEVRRSWRARIGALLMRPAFLELRRRIDYEEEGGAPLLGINKVVIIAHGSSSERAIENAVQLAAKLVANDLPRQTSELLQEIGAHVSGDPEKSPSGPA